jgi:hypothetical protein
MENYYRYNAPCLSSDTPTVLSEPFCSLIKMATNKNSVVISYFSNRSNVTAHHKTHTWHTTACPAVLPPDRMAWSAMRTTRVADAAKQFVI